MSRIANEARTISAYATQKPPRSPPSNLTEEQQTYWREILQDLPANHIKSDCALTLVELCRHLSYAAQIAESLTKLRDANLIAVDEDREVFVELLQLAREQSCTIALSSTKLRLTNQSRDDSVAAKRARLREPTGLRPWEPLQNNGDGLDS